MFVYIFDDFFPNFSSQSWPVTNVGQTVQVERDLGLLQKTNLESSNKRHSADGWFQNQTSSPAHLNIPKIKGGHYNEIPLYLFFYLTPLWIPKMLTWISQSPSYSTSKSRTIWLLLMSVSSSLELGGWAIMLEILGEIVPRSVFSKRNFFGPWSEIMTKWWMFVKWTWKSYSHLLLVGQTIFLLTEASGSRVRSHQLKQWLHTLQIWIRTFEWIFQKHKLSAICYLGDNWVMSSFNQSPSNSEDWIIPIVMYDKFWAL